MSDLYDDAISYCKEHNPWSGMSQRLDWKTGFVAAINYDSHQPSEDDNSVFASGWREGARWLELRRATQKKSYVSRLFNRLMERMKKPVAGA